MKVIYEITDPGLAMYLSGGALCFLVYIAIIIITRHDYKQKSTGEIMWEFLSVTVACFIVGGLVVFGVIVVAPFWLIGKGIDKLRNYK